MRRTAIALLLLFGAVQVAAAQDGARASVGAVIAAKELQTHFDQLSATQSTPDYSKPPASELFRAIFNTAAIPKAGATTPKDLNWLLEWVGASSGAYGAMLNFGAAPGAPLTSAVAAKNIIQYEDEMSRAMEFLLRISPRLASTAVSFMESLPEKERNQPVRQQGLARMRSGLMQTLSGSVTFLGSQPKANNARMLAAALRDTAPEWVRFTTADDRTNVLGLLAKARTTAKDDKVTDDLLAVSKVFADAK